MHLDDPALGLCNLPIYNICSMLLRASTSTVFRSTLAKRTASMQPSIRPSDRNWSNPARAASHDLVAVLVILIKPQTASDEQRFSALPALRHRHDRAFDKWLPHITLMPPFILTVPSSASDPETQPIETLHSDKLSSLVHAIREICHHHPSHSLLLDQVSTFPLRSNTNVHLRPYPTNFTDRSAPASTRRNTDDDSTRLIHLQSHLSTSLHPLLTSPGVRSNSRSQVFKPHVSVGQTTSPKATWQLCTAAERIFTPHQQEPPGLLCRVDSIQLMIKRRGDEGAYRIHAEIPLAQAKV